MHFPTWKQDCLLRDQNTAFFYAKSHTDEKRKIKLGFCAGFTDITELYSKFLGNINTKWETEEKEQQPTVLE